MQRNYWHYAKVLVGSYGEPIQDPLDELGDNG